MKSEPELNLAINLPTIPAVALEVLRLSKNPESSIEEMSAVISSDPALSVRIINLANSPNYRRGADITSIPAAVMALGLKSVTLLALSFSLAKGLARSSDSSAFPYILYWQRSIINAVAASGLARHLKMSTSNEAFLCGLLSRIGQLMMAESMEAEYCNVLKESGEHLPSIDLEQRTLGFDFTQVSSYAMKKWGFPDLIRDAIGKWAVDSAEIESLDEQTQTLCSLLRLADTIGAVLLGSTESQHLSQLHGRAKQDFDLSEEEIDELIVQLEESVKETASSLDIDMASIDFERSMDEARDRMLEISLMSAMDLQRTEQARDELAKDKDKLEKAVETDQLTGVYSRAYLEKSLARLICCSTKRDTETVGLLILDLDHFKSVNDNYGHLAGDELLRHVATTVQNRLRGGDFVARYGGEEFIILLMNTTQEGMGLAAERIRASIEEAAIVREGETISVTASLGGAYSKLDEDVCSSDLLKTADDNLYKAKEKRNCFVGTEFSPAVAQEA